MTPAEVREWAMGMIRDAARERDFAMGVLAVLAGSFDEAKCGPPGSAQESDECEGGREAMLRLGQPEPAGRVSHGAGFIITEVKT
jgi:hypothetical protein